MNKEDMKDVGMYIGNEYDVLGNATKVHTKQSQLNEDATLANLDVKFTPLAEWVSRNIHTLHIIESYLRIEEDEVKRFNYVDYGCKDWGKIRRVLKTPTRANFEKIKKLIMSHVQARLIVSRSVKGAPLKAFLTYNRDTRERDLGMEEKRSVMDRLLNKKQEEDIV